ncbi:hypothetical protein [Rhodospirillum sp. A1_3_36]|uniref:hypothetical protein n=1 Tax=Rhodospirillum sp. A1_3_36 TaxID=3391666 RepID=UPI0039A659C2
MADFDLTTASLKQTIDGMEKIPVCSDGQAAAVTVDQVQGHLVEQIKPLVDASEAARAGAEAAQAAAQAAAEAVDATGVLLIDGSRAMNAALDLGGHGLVNLLEPVNATDGATKDYVDGKVGGGGGGQLCNLLINARGQVNQRRYVSGTAISAAGQYTLDRWRVVAAGEAFVWTTVDGTAVFTAPAGGVEQVIEGANILTGTHVLSFTGTATCTVDGASKVSGDTVVLTGGQNCTVRFSGGTFSLPQIERGAVAGPFDSRHVQTELALCQRYYCRSRAGARFYSSGAGASIENIVYWPSEMRTAPTTIGPVGGSYVNVASGVLYSPDQYGVRFYLSSASSGDCYAVGPQVTADAEI